MVKATKFTVDSRFTDHFRRLRQVFLYINDQCNLSCAQCIYKPQVTYHDDRDIPLPIAAGLLDVMGGLGARKLTLLGGEPTMYGRSTGGEALGDLLRHAREQGYSYLRMDTNGHFPSSLYDRAGLTQLDEMAFSLDGYDSRTNDGLRGLGTFTRIVKQVREARRRGLSTSLTCCIHRLLVKFDESGVTGVERVIRLAETLGVETVNFHDLFKAGVPMDTWTGNHDTSVEDHVAMYADVKAKVGRGDFTVKVRLPQCFVTRAEFESNPDYYGYCPVKLGERVMIHSDGVIRICSNLICTSFGSAVFTGSDIRWNDAQSNEMLGHDLTTMTPCTNRSKNKRYGDYVPVCFSFKPDQDEPSWNSLEWDERKQALPGKRLQSTSASALGAPPNGPGASLTLVSERR